MRIKLAVAALFPVLTACAGGAVPNPGGRPVVRPPISNPRAAVRPPAHRPPPSPRVQMAPGLEGVIGARGEELTRQFGPARLDVWEGDARKLQFSGTACVLDVYLYPPTPGQTPIATYVDARRASDGQDVDRGACVAALRR